MKRVSGGSSFAPLGRRIWGAGIALAWAFWVMGCARTNDPETEVDMVARRAKLLAYFQGLTGKADQRVLSGQFCGSYGELSSGYSTYMEGLFRQTGKYCAILGSDLEDLSTQNQSGAHAILKSFWDQKGLVTLSWHAANPWTGGDSWDRSRVTLWDLSDSSSRVYTRWVAQVDSVAAALKDLSASGVVVLFRPFHEMNGDWFWWGASSQSNDPAAFVALWQWLYRYLTEQHQLTNLIWVYSPNAVTHSSYVKPVGWAYPGADRVDLVALDIYTDYLVIRDYADLVALQKPLGISEFGPGDGRSGNYDNTETIRAIREHYPQIVFWAQYCDWQNRNGFWVYKSLLRNPNAAALLNDSWVLTRDELNWLD